MPYYMVSVIYKSLAELGWRLRNWLMPWTHPANEVLVLHHGCDSKVEPIQMMEGLDYNDDDDSKNMHFSNLFIYFLSVTFVRI